MKTRWIIYTLIFLLVAGCSTKEDAAPKKETVQEEAIIQFNPPSLDDVPDGPMGEAILKGHAIVDRTNDVVPDYSGNSLSCSSCHAGAGLNEKVSPLVGVTAVYPQYRPREGVVFTLEDRINGCMVRSMNGKMFPEDSEEMRAMMAYFTYISEGIPVGADIPWRVKEQPKDYPVPSVEDGKELYTQSCMTCHGENGEGIGANTGPALWGDESFNTGAGLSRFQKLAGYIQKNMPVGQEGTLDDQEVANLAAYILSQERPEYSAHDKDWPNGDRPKDIINKQQRDALNNGTLTWEEIVKPKE